MRASLFALVLLAAPAAAQEVRQVASPILVIDQERLVSEMSLGSEEIAALEARALQLAEENQQIEAQLIDQERALTERRPTLSPEEFTALADEFDARVQQIRAEQDEKAQELTRAQAAASQALFGQVGNVVAEIVRERGALVVIDRRNVLLSAEQIDITDEAIERLNASPP